MWQYYSENWPGNLHDAVLRLNMLAQQHPQHEIVALDHNARNTVVVYRLPFPSINITIERKS